MSEAPQSEATRRILSSRSKPSTLMVMGNPCLPIPIISIGLGGGTDWLWGAFMQGNNPLSMDDMESTGLTGNLSYAGIWDPTKLVQMIQNRTAIQQTRTVASMVDLTAMTPQGALASTGLCLADTAGSMYLVYASSGEQHHRRPILGERRAPQGTMAEYSRRIDIFNYNPNRRGIQPRIQLAIRWIAGCACHYAIMDK